MRKSLMITIVSVALSLQVTAQDNGQNGPRHFDQNEMIQRRTESTASRYGLDDSQKAKLLELNKKYADVMPMMGPRGGGPGRMGGMRPGQGNQNDNNVQGDNQNSRPREGMRPGGPGPGRGNGPGRFRPDPEKMQQYETELQSIMTPEQYAKYQEDRKAMMERMGQMRRGEGRPQDRQ